MQGTINRRAQAPS